MKPALFHAAAKVAIRTFPREVRRELGKAVYDLQCGQSLGMPLSKPLPSVANGVSELRFRDRSGIYRVFYYLKSDRGVLVFHAFEKRTRKTPTQDIELGRRRLQELLHEET